MSEDVLSGSVACSIVGCGAEITVSFRTTDSDEAADVTLVNWAAEARVNEGETVTCTACRHVYHAGDILQITQ